MKTKFGFKIKFTSIINSTGPLLLKSKKNISAHSLNPEMKKML